MPDRPLCHQHRSCCKQVLAAQLHLCLPCAEPCPLGQHMHAGHLPFFRPAALVRYQSCCTSRVWLYAMPPLYARPRVVVHDRLRALHWRAVLMAVIQGVCLCHCAAFCVACSPADAVLHFLLAIPVIFPMSSSSRAHPTLFPPPSPIPNLLALGLRACGAPLGPTAIGRGGRRAPTWRLHAAGTVLYILPAAVAVDALAPALAPDVQITVSLHAPVRTPARPGLVV